MSMLIFLGRNGIEGNCNLYLLHERYGAPIIFNIRDKPAEQVISQWYKLIP